MNVGTTAMDGFTTAIASRLLDHAALIGAATQQKTCILLCDEQAENALS